MVAARELHTLEQVQDRLHILELLLAHGASVYAACADGITAFHLAAAAGQIDLLRCLLTASAQCMGSPTTFSSSNNSRSSNSSSRWSATALTCSLSASSCSVGLPLLLAVARGSPEPLQLLLQEGHLAATYRHIAALQRPASIPLPLHVAAMVRHPDGHPLVDSIHAADAAAASVHMGVAQAICCDTRIGRHLPSTCDLLQHLAIGMRCQYQDL
jgi:hypothetical protein